MQFTKTINYRLLQNLKGDLKCSSTKLRNHILLEGHLYFEVSTGKQSMVSPKVW